MAQNVKGNKGYVYRVLMGGIIRIFTLVNFGSLSKSYVNLRYVSYYENTDSDGAVVSDL
jgi:hypothetical protein